MKFLETAALIFAEILVSLLLFSVVVSLLVIIIRKPLRKYKTADLAIFEKVKPSVSDFNNSIMLFITFLGKHQFLIPANLILISYFLVIHKDWFSIRVITISVSSLVLMLLLKYLFHRKRPLAPLLKAARGLSFPSGHAIMAVTFYGLLIYILRNTISVEWIKDLATFLLIVLIIWIGYSRIYLRVHYASDVAAGFIIGLSWLLISLAVINKLETFFISMDQFPDVSSVFK